MQKKPITVKSGLSPPPNMNIPQNKSRILSKFQEDDIFGEQEIDLEDEFKTLKLSDLNQFQKPTLKNNKSNYNMKDYASDFEFEDEIPNLEFKLNEPVNEDLRLSPGTLSSSSRRKSLSEYSEGTDVTSNFNEEEFEDIDDIFGAPNEESQEISKLHIKLKSKQQHLQSIAENEEKELLRRYRNDEMATLRGRDFDILESDRTINYDFTRDDFDDFEKGFDINGLDNRLQLKQSMPDIRRESINKKNMKKFQSSYNLNSYVNSESKKMEGYNSGYNNPKFDDKVMRKLERIPSFNQKKLNQMMEKNENFRVTKEQLLQQYQEIDKQHKKTNQKILNLKKSMSMPAKRGKKIGLVKYLGDVPVTGTNSTMKYNHKLKNWEGNEIELMKFSNMNTKRPSLIKFDDYMKKSKSSSQIPRSQSSHNMVFDPVNLKWVSKDAEDEDVFKDVTELEDQKRGASIFTARTISTKVEEEPNVYIVSKKLIDRFLKEENKIGRKTQYWFNKDDTYNMDTTFNYEYYWDIRKLIMDTDK